MARRSRSRDDLFHKTVRVPVCVNASGELRYFYGGVLPKLREGALGELVVRATDFVQPDVARQLITEESLPLLPIGTTLLVEVSAGSGSRAGVQEFRAMPKGPSLRAVAVVALEDQKIQLRGTKLGRLEPADWRIPALDATAGSLNEAYSKVSVAFERHRYSNTGNVFQKVWYPTQEGWSQLNNLRSRAEAQIENRLQLLGTGTRRYLVHVLGHWAPDGVKHLGVDADRSVLSAGRAR